MGLIRGDRKLREIERRIDLAPFGGVFTVKGVQGTRHEEISSLVDSFRPTHLHIACHGQPGQLILEDARRLPAKLDLEALKAIIDGPKTIRCLVLEACYSASLAERLKTDELSTLGISGKYSPSETDFGFATFYQALAANRPFREAYAEALQDLEIMSRAAARTPRLFASSTALESKLFGDGEDPSSFGVDDTVAGIALARPLRLRPDGVVLSGFAETRRRLDESWAQKRGIVHLRGAPGSGRTRVLAEWLADLAERGWPGARRVFAWSFRSTPEDRLSGDVPSFLEMFLEFLDEPWIRTESTSEWELGRFIGRLLQRERCLLILDGIELLPGPPDIATIEARLRPGLVALLRSVEHGPSLCVLTTRDDLSFERLDHQPIEPPPLGDSDLISWLWSRGAIDSGEPLLTLAARFSRNPLALSWAAATAATNNSDSAPVPKLDPLSPWDRTMEWIDSSCSQGEREFLAALVLADGRLTELEDGPQAGYMSGQGSLAVLRSLTRRGLIHVSRRMANSPPDGQPQAAKPTTAEITVVADHPRLVDLLLRNVIDRASLEAALEPAPQPLKNVEDFPSLRQRLRAHIALGDGASAVRLYIDRIAQYKWPSQWSYICRSLGRHADDLLFLGELFSAPWTALHPTLAETAADDSAYIFHRVGLALRHVGRIAEASAPIERSFAISMACGAGRHIERAATCANDLGEIHAFLGDLNQAAEWAQRGVCLATKYLDSTPENLRQARVCLSLSLATAGEILRRQGSADAATENFRLAEVETEKVADLDGCMAREGQRFLFSRPGYYFWQLLLQKIEAAIADGDAGTTTHLIKDLDERLSESLAWVCKPNIAKVTRAYEKIVRARLLSAQLLVAENDTDADINRAEAYFADALALLHDNHHVWMVPEVLQARALLRERADDPIAARVDREEASRLTARLGPVQPGPAPTG